MYCPYAWRICVRIFMSTGHFYSSLNMQNVPLARDHEYESKNYVDILLQFQTEWSTFFLQNYFMSEIHLLPIILFWKLFVFPKFTLYLPSPTISWIKIDKSETPMLCYPSLIVNVGVKKSLWFLSAFQVKSNDIIIGPKIPLKFFSDGKHTKLYYM